MKKISKQQKIMNEVKEELTEDDIKEFKEFIDKGDSSKASDMKDLGMSEEEYDTIVDDDDDRYEEDKHDKHNGPGGIKLTDEQLKEAARMIAETEAYIKKKEGNITFSDLKAFDQDKETIRNAFRARQSIQKCRINAGNQMGAITRLAAYNGQDRHPIAIMAAYQHLLAAEELLDKNLKQFASMYAVGVWAQSVCGIGPVFAASLLSLLELKDRKYAGQFWAYAGMTGRYDWDVKQKGKPVKYNPDLKTLCYKIGVSFMKQKDKPKCEYGKLYDKMVEVYEERNEAGGFKELAKLYLSKKKWDPNKRAYKAYSKGKIPPSHIKSMARRYAVKRFLAHLFEAFWYSEHYFDGLRDKCPDPYVEEHLGHHKIIHAPNLYIIDQWYENNGYDNYMANIERTMNDNPDKNIDEVIKPENDAQVVIVNAYKTVEGKHRVKMRLKMTKVEPNKDSTNQ